MPNMRGSDTLSVSLMAVSGYSISGTKSNHRRIFKSFPCQSQLSSSPCLMSAYAVQSVFNGSRHITHSS
jgi:hypothetical protein